VESPEPVRDDGRPEAVRRDALAYRELAERAAGDAEQARADAGVRLSRARAELDRLGSSGELEQRVEALRRQLPAVAEPPPGARRGVRVWRRFTGGGAVYLDQGVVCAGLVVPAGHADARLPVPALYAPFLAAMARACRALGADASADERAVRVAGHKVTGIAA